MGYHPWDLSTEELIEYLKVGLHTLYSISKQHARLALFPYGSCADKPTRVLQWSYLGGVVYTLAAYFTKVTLLLLIARLLSVKRHVVLGIYAFILAVTIYCFVVFLLKAFACQPVAALWDFRMQADFCVDKRKVYLSETVIDFGTNVAIMVVPIPFITPLRTSLAGKIKIGTLFGIGGIGIFVGAYRLYVVIQFFTEVDATGKAILPCTLSSVTLYSLGSSKSSPPCDFASASSFPKQHAITKTQGKKQKKKKKRKQRCGSLFTNSATGCWS